MSRTMLLNTIAINLALLGILLVPPATAQDRDDSPAKSKGAAPETKAEPGPNREYALLVTPEKHIKGMLNLWMEAPEMRAREWVVYAAALPVLPGQTGVSSTLDPGGQPARELSQEHRPVLRARVPAETPERKKGLDLRVEYQATLWSRRLVPARENRGIPAPPPLGADERRAALASGGFFDFNSPAFQKWLKDEGLRRGPKEGEIDFARRVFLTIKKGFQFAYRENMERQASRVCRAGESDAGGLAVLFVSALRANRIPARVLVGRWAQSATLIDGKTNDQQHAESEFHAQGVGWVPADLASAVLRDESPEGLTFFGNDPGDFLVMHVDTNVICDTIHFGRQTVAWFQRPALWVVGQGDFGPGVTKERWSVEAGPAPDLVEATLTKPAPGNEPPKSKRPSSPRR